MPGSRSRCGRSRCWATSLPASVRRPLDLPAFWAILLVVQFPAIYLAGAAAMVGALARKGAAAAEKRLDRRICPAGRREPRRSLAVRQHHRQQRPRLARRAARGPGADHLRRGGPVAMARDGAEARGGGDRLLGDGCPGRLAHRRGERRRACRPRRLQSWRKTPELWAAVRRHTAPDERVANNPLFLADSVRWPVNISWALFADRRSCFAGWNLARAFVPLPGPEIDRINALFERVFAGAGSPQDIRDLATRYDCRVIVVDPRRRRLAPRSVRRQPLFPPGRRKAGAMADLPGGRRRRRADRRSQPSAARGRRDPQKRQRDPDRPPAATRAASRRPWICRRCGDDRASALRECASAARAALICISMFQP